MSLELKEEILINKRNDISIAISVRNLQEKANEFGSILFHKGVMGARVVSKESKQKKFQDLILNKFGSHSEQSDQFLPYLTIAVAIGSKWKELQNFIKIF